MSFSVSATLYAFILIGFCRSQCGHMQYKMHRSTRSLFGIIVSQPEDYVSILTIEDETEGKRSSNQVGKNMSEI